MTGPFFLSILVFVFFGPVRQIKMAIRQLLGARKYSLSYCIVSYRIVKLQKFKNYFVT